MKLFCSSSTSGPHATSKPSERKISRISSRTRVMGWRWPLGRARRPGSVRSKGAALSSAERASLARSVESSLERGFDLGFDAVDAFADRLALIEAALVRANAGPP